MDVKPSGFHWDFFLLGCTTFIARIIGIPMPSGLVPHCWLNLYSPFNRHTLKAMQAPVRTDSPTVYETAL